MSAHATNPTGREADPPTARAAPHASPASVASLTAAMAAGDRGAYAELFAARCDQVERLASRRLGRRRDLVGDVAQETWLRVARAPRRCESPEKLDAWLGRIVASAVVDLLRSELARRSREERVAFTRCEVEDFVADVELLEEARGELAALAHLSSEERSLLELRTRTGATLSQLAAMLGLGRAAVDSRLRRAAKLAREAFEARTAEGELP